MFTDLKLKAEYRKQVSKQAPGERILICEKCFVAGRRCVYQGWNASQHVTTKKNIGCTLDGNISKVNLIITISNSTK